MSQTTDRSGPTHGTDGDTDAPTVVLRRPMITPWPVSQPTPAAPAGSSTPRALPSRRGRGIVIGSVAVVVVVLALIGLAVNRASDVQGSVTIRGISSYATPGVSCYPFASVTRTVSLYGGSGQLVGVANLPATGVAVVQDGSYGSYADACRYSFTLPDIHLSDDFYRLTIDADATNGVSFTRDDIVRNGANIVVNR